jgi:hypothetical protein
MLRRGLDRRREAEADIRYAVYRRPAGRGLHIVVNRCNGQEQLVGSVAGRRAFKPGAELPLGSHSSHPGEVILGLAPVDRVGVAEHSTPQVVPTLVGSPRILSADPATIAAGAVDQLTTLTGVLIRPGLTVRAVLYDETAQATVGDPLVTVDTYTYLSPTSATVLVDVDSSAPEGYRIALEIL